MLATDVNDVWEAHDSVIKSAEIDVARREQPFELHHGCGVVLGIV